MAVRVKETVTSPIETTDAMHECGEKIVVVYQGPVLVCYQSKKGSAIARCPKCGHTIYQEDLSSWEVQQIIRRRK